MNSKGIFGFCVVIVFSSFPDVLVLSSSSYYLLELVVGGVPPCLSFPLPHLQDTNNPDNISHDS